MFLRACVCGADVHSLLLHHRSVGQDIDEDEKTGVCGRGTGAGVGGKRGLKGEEGGRRDYVETTDGIGAGAGARREDRRLCLVLGAADPMMMMIDMMSL